MNINTQGNSVVAGVVSRLPVTPANVRGFKQRLNCALGDYAPLTVSYEHRVAERLLLKPLLDLTHFERRASCRRNFRVIFGRCVTDKKVDVRVSGGARLLEEAWRHAQTKDP